MTTERTELFSHARTRVNRFQTFFDHNDYDPYVHMTHNTENKNSLKALCRPTLHNPLPRRATVLRVLIC